MRWAVLLAVFGLFLLALSLIGPHPTDLAPNGAEAAVWLGACFAGARGADVRPDPATSRCDPRASPRACCSRAATSRRSWSSSAARWFLALLPLVVAYAFGSIELQSAFQEGDALAPAGIATLANNAVPIAAGVVLFGETLPGGIYRVLQLAAFTAIVAGAVMLSATRAQAQPPARGSGSSRGRAARRAAAL